MECPAPVRRFADANQSLIDSDSDAKPVATPVDTDINHVQVRYLHGFPLSLPLSQGMSSLDGSRLSVDVKIKAIAPEPRSIRNGSRPRPRPTSSSWDWVLTARVGHPTINKM